MFRLSAAKLIVLTVVTFFLDLYIAPFLTINGIKPDLWILLLLFYAFRVDWKRAPILAFGIGLMKELLSTRFFGIEIFSLGIPTLLLSYLIGKVEREDPIILISSAAIFSFAYELLSLASFVYLKGAYALLVDLLIRALWISLYTIVSFPLFFSFLEYLASPRARNFLRRDRHAERYRETFQ